MSVAFTFVTKKISKHLAIEHVEYADGVAKYMIRVLNPMTGVYDVTRVVEESEYLTLSALPEFKER